MDLLTDVERARAARLRRVSDRRSFVAAHVLVRLCSAHLFAVSPNLTLEQVCAGCGGPHGAAHLRELPGAEISMSHSGGVVAVAVAPTPVGVDVEPLTSGIGLADDVVHIATLTEQREIEAAGDPRYALLLLWVRKEAMVKLGLARLDELGDLDLSGLPHVPPSAEQPRRLRWKGYSIVDLSLVEPAAVGAVVSECEIELMPLARLRAP